MLQSQMRLIVLVSLLSACKTHTGSTLTGATDVGGFSTDLTSYIADASTLRDFRQEWDAIPGNDFCRLALRIVNEPSYRSRKLPYYKLKVEEAVAVQQYSLIPGINDVLRKSDENELKTRQNIILSTASGLNRLPRHAGKVFRGAGLSEEVINIYRESLNAGTPIVDKTFLSTSMNPDVALGFAKSKVLFVIASKSGHLIEGISLYKNEREVLFPPGSEFKVISVSSKTAEEIKALSSGALPAMTRVNTSSDPASKVQGCVAGRAAGMDDFIDIGGMGGMTLKEETASSAKFFGPVGNVGEMQGSGRPEAQPTNLLTGSEAGQSTLTVIELEDVTP